LTVADTDVLIDFLAGAEPASTTVAEVLERGSLYTTVISRFELLSGVRGARQQTAVRELLAAVAALPLDADAADKAAAVRQSLDQSGQPVGMADSLIAGIVLSRAGALLTRNVRHFARVAGLRLVDPGIGQGS
jgi:tRNA(fMet)-specific endonuclease VapC